MSEILLCKRLNEEKKAVLGSMDHTSLQHFLFAGTLDEITKLF